MATALGRRAKRLDVSVQARAMIAPAPLIVVAAAAAVSAAMGLVAVPELTPLGLGAVGCVGAFVVWQGLSMLWSIEPDRTWNYLNRAVVYLAFLLLGLVVGRLRRAPEYAAGWLAVVTAAAVCSALGTKIFPGLSAETERVSRLNTPIGYWNVLALLVVFALPLALWIAAPPNRPDWLRAPGVLYLYAALVLGGAAAVAGAFWASRYERARPLSETWRLRAGRAAVAAVAVAVVVAIGALLAAGITPSRVLHKFNEPTATSQGQGANNLTNFSSSSRWNWWQEAWKSWKAHPVVGTGAGTFDLTHRKLRVDGTVATEPHNLPLQFLSETGIIGFVLFLGIAFLGAAALVETLRRLEREDRLAAAALVVALFAYVVHGVVDFDWDFVAVTAPAMAAFGVLLAAGRRARVRVRERRGLLAVAAGALAAATLYSLASPWLASRRIDDAYAALERGDAGAAVADAKSAHDLNPVSVDALLAWGQAESSRGNTAAAGRIYTKAISIQPDNWRPWYYRARLLANVSGPKAALFDAQQAAARDPRGLAGAYAASLAT